MGYGFGAIGNESADSFIIGNPDSGDVQNVYNEASNLASAFANNTAVARVAWDTSG